MDQFIIRAGRAEDLCFLDNILDETRASAIARGTGIAERSAIFITEKIMSGLSIIATTHDHKWAGFAFLHAYNGGLEVSHSGMIVSPLYRNAGIARLIKTELITLSRRSFPQAAMISITTTHAVMKMNSQYGFVPVTYEALTNDADFWEGCMACVNHSILASKSFKQCICTAMRKEVIHD